MAPAKAPASGPGGRDGVDQECVGLTFAGFMAWSSVHGGRPMLVKDLVYLCLAEFGMRPAKAAQEREVIQEIFRRCARVSLACFCVGWCFFLYFVHFVLWRRVWVFRCAIYFLPWLCCLFQRQRGSRVRACYNLAVALLVRRMLVAGVVGSREGGLPV